MIFQNIILIALLSFSGINKPFSGKVISISDGDTFTLLQGKEQIKVRLYGVDCPEKSQAFGQKAKLFTSNQIFGKEVTVIPHGKDRYGRVIGEVLLLNGTTLNKELIRNGFAWWYRQYAPKNDTLRILEDSARIARVGLWADPNPLEPWNFRKNKANHSEIIPKNDPIKSDSPQNSVYLNLKSKKFHCRSCNYVKDCQNCVLVPIERAKRDGVACGVCGGECR